MPDALIATEFAGYRIDRRIGRGGMGVVYLATDLTLERSVALKVLAEELAKQPGLPAPLRRRVEARCVAGPSERHPDLRRR